MADNKVKILCVEDEIDIRSNIADILRDEGFEVVEAENGRRGYEVFIQERPDLIISDIMMPELDGYGLLKMVRETNSSKDSAVPFILLTALGQKDNVLKGVSLNANDYLVKPIDFDLLIAKAKEKTQNFKKVENVHQEQIQNIKSQLAVVLPKDVFHYLDIISQIASNLKNEPFGPLPHRAYLDEIQKIYLNCVSLRSVINNSLDEAMIDFKLKAQEEIIALTEILQGVINDLKPDIGSRISLSNIESLNLLPQIKVDRFVLHESLKLILNDLAKSVNNPQIMISAIMDHLKQMVIIFYVESDDKNIEIAVDENKISSLLDKQNCRFQILTHKKNATISIPEYRVIH